LPNWILYFFLRPNNFLVKGSFDPDFHLRRVADACLLRSKLPRLCNFVLKLLRSYFLCCTATLCVHTMLCPTCWPYQGAPWIHYFVCLIIAVCPIQFFSNVFDLSCNVLAIIHRITGDILLEGVRSRPAP
jgi:hypothetical protein